MIQEQPTAEQLEAFHMLVRHEDTFTDYRIDLEKLTDASKAELCRRFAIEPDDLEGKTVLTLCISAEV